MTQSDKKEKEKEMRKAESVPEKGKQLSRKAADKLKFYGVAAVLSLLCAGFIWFIFKPDTTETVEGTAGINTTIPDAIAPETMTDKQKAYELERMKKRRQEHVGRAEAGKSGTGTGRYPGVTATATTNIKTDSLVLSGTERQSQGKRSGTAGEGA